MLEIPSNVCRPHPPRRAIGLSALFMSPTVTAQTATAGVDLWP